MTVDEPLRPAEGAIERSREHRAGVRQACTELDRALASPTAKGAQEWAGPTRQALHSVQVAFARHVQISEGPNGLLAEIVAQAPRLAHAVQRVRDDHGEILGQIRSVEGRIGDLAAVDEARREALALLTHIAEHRHTGANLVHDAFLVDLEAAD